VVPWRKRPIEREGRSRCDSPDTFIKEQKATMFRKREKFKVKLDRGQRNGIIFGGEESAGRPLSYKPQMLFGGGRWSSRVVLETPSGMEKK